MTQDKINSIKYLNLLNTQLENRQEKLYKRLSKTFDKGELLKVERNGIWEVEFVGADFGQYAGYFRAKSKNGKIHTFHFHQIITESQLKQGDIQAVKHKGTVKSNKIWL